MGLEDVAHDIGSFGRHSNEVKITMSDEQLSNILATNPRLAVMFARNSSERTTRHILAVLDDIIQNDLSGWNVGEDGQKESEEVRPEVLETL